MSTKETSYLWNGHLNKISVGRETGRCNLHIAYGITNNLWKIKFLHISKLLIVKFTSYKLMEVG